MENFGQSNDRHMGHQFSNIRIHGDNRAHLGDSITVNHNHYYSGESPLPESARLNLQNEGKIKENLWLVPFPRNDKFVGRQNEINQLKDFILKDNGPKKIALTGLGGVGKTQVALELAYCMKDTEYSVLWIPSMSPESMDQAYMSIAQHFALPNVSPADTKMRVKSHLSHKDAGKWLLIYDNADDIDMWIHGNGTIPALKSILPQSDHGRIIFTSRTRRLANRLAPSNVIIIPDMDEGTAKEVLQKSLIQKDTDDDATTTALLQQLTFLPLAIAQAAAYINETGIKLSDYLALLQEQEQDVIELLSEDFEDDGRYVEIQNSVVTTWFISFRQIQQLNSISVDYLSFMACINPRNIPVSLLPPAKSRKEQTDALGLLNAYSFTTTQEDGSLSLHRLVHLATRNWMRQDNRLQSWTCKTADRLNEIFPDSQHTNRKLWRGYLPHCLILINGAEFQREKNKYLALIQRVGDCLFSDGRYNEAQFLYDYVMKTYKQERGDEHRDTLTSMGNLALIYMCQGRLEEAEKLNMQVIEIYKQMLGDKDLNTLKIMNNLALTYIELGRWKEAEKLNVQVTKITKQVLRDEHSYTLGSMSNLALTYRNQGRWKEAEELNLQVTKTYKQLLGDEDLDTLNSMSNLASTYMDQGRWKEAEELNVQVTKTCKQLLGDEHPHTLGSMNNLASTYWNQGRWKEAEELEVQVMGTYKQIFGDKHPDTLISMNNLAHALKSVDKVEAAILLMNECVQLCIEQLGPDNPFTVSSTESLTEWQAISKSSCDESFESSSSTGGLGSPVLAGISIPTSPSNSTCEDVT